MNECEFCGTESNEVKLVPFRSVLVYMCPKCIQDEVDKYNKSVAKPKEIE